MIEYEALNPSLYAKVLDDLELVHSHKPFQILFYGSRERGDFDPLSDLNFYLLAHSTDQMKPSFIESISLALNHLESVAPMNMIAGDIESLRLRMKIHEPGSVQLLENATVFFGDSLWENLKRDWLPFRQREIAPSELSSYLEKRVRFFKQQVVKNAKEEISQLERICTLTLHIWAIKNVYDLTIAEIIKMDTPSQIGPLFMNLYKNELDENIVELLELQKKLYSLKRAVRWKKDISREKLYELKYKLISLRKDEEFLLNH